MISTAIQHLGKSICDDGNEMKVGQSRTLTAPIRGPGYDPSDGQLFLFNFIPSNVSYFVLLCNWYMY